ncbi:bolA-like protein [Candidatus Blochmanniella vafra str. BVAF]|uniref:BolA-like protein n=1 Tax=Blochmanniella vafra (strain BVAF) TaxID=859654 RepID=E8Q6L7_BLOVB|nr:BolA/IbaG family iron-sulfur metabolism protein [Candidatus Blochmannia vafer]ADV33458.1 bolA-like protein [Candidatus Blochmannia vafer str. BVAF]
MNADKIKEILLSCLNLSEVYVAFDYHGHCQIIAIGSMFIEKNKLERHKIVYAPLKQYITYNKIHSLSIYAFSLNEWDINKKFYNVK